MARSPETCPGGRGLVTLLLASILFAAVVSVFFAVTPAGAQGRRPRTPKQETQNAAGTANSPPAQKKRLTPLRSSDSQQGSRMTITSDGVLSAYSAYRSGDRFYVVIPKADAPGAQSQIRGRGFEDARMQKKGDDTVLSFRLQPGAKAHVEQKFNKLDVVINTPEQSTNSNTLTSANTTRIDKTSTAALTSPAGTRNSNQSIQNGSAQPMSSPEGTARASANQPTNAAAPGTTVAPGNTTLPPLSSVMQPTAPSPSASPTPAAPVNQVAQAQPQPTVPSATTISNPGAPSSSLGAAITRHWLPVLFAALLLLGIIGVVAARSMTQRRAVPPPPGEKEGEAVKASPISEAALAPSETAFSATPIAAATTATERVKEAGKASRAPAPRKVETKRKETATPVEINRAEAEVKKLLAGQNYDEAVIGASDAGTRQIVAAGLLSALAGRNISRREVAREAFIKHNYLDEATSGLRTAKAPAERASAARSLGLVKDRVATSHLVAALDDAAPEVRRAAVEALAELHDPSALAPLESLLEREKDRQVPRSLIRRAINASAAGLEEERAPIAPSPLPAGENLTGGAVPSGTEAGAGISTEAASVAAGEGVTVTAGSPTAELSKPSGSTIAEAPEPAVVSEASSVTAIEPLIEEESRSVAEAEARDRAEAEAARKRTEESARIEAEARQRAEEERRRRTEEEKARQRQEALRRASEERQRAEARRQAEDAARLQREEEEARRQAEAGRSRAQAEATPPSSVTEVAADATQAVEPSDLTGSLGIRDSSVAASPEVSARGSETTGEWIDLKGSGIDLYSPTTSSSPPTAVEKSIDTPETVSVEPSLQAPESLIDPVMLPDTSAIELVEEYPATAVTDKTGQIVADKSIEVADEDFSTVPGAIRKRLGSEDVSERASAIVDLANVGGEDSFREITAAFDDPSTEVRNAAARALYNLSTDRAASFTRALREAPPERRRHIGGALASSGLASEAIGNLTGESRDKTYDAFSLLFLMSKAGEVQPLMKAIEEHPNNEVRLAVVKLLALSGQQEILPAFRRLAVRGSLPTEIRSAVMEAIYQISSQASSDTSSAA